MGLSDLPVWRSLCRGRTHRRAVLHCGSACFVVLISALLAGAQTAPLASPLLELKGNGYARVQHRERARKFLAGRSVAGFGPAAMDAARQRQIAMLAQPQTSAMVTKWQPVGPLQVASLAYGKVTGRITAIAIDPADATGNTVYVGTTGGGVWKSTNAAGAAASVTFAPLTDTLPVFALDSGHSAIASLSIGALSAANGVILAGTGDTNDALDSYYGSGLIRSADGGATWTLTQQSNDGANGVHSFVGLGFAGLAQSTVSQSVAVAAVAESAEGTFVNAGDSTYSVRGLYFSNDAGVTWQMAIIKDGGQTVQQPLANGQNLGGNAATAVVWNPVRQRFYAAVRFHGYYESTDGSVWTRLAAQPGAGLTTAACPTNPGTIGSVNCPIFRGALAVEPISGDTYAFTVDANNGDQGIWRDVCSATNGSCAAGQIAFGTKLNATPLETSSGVVLQGDYDLSLAAMASGNNTLLFAGALDLYRCSVTTAASDAGGCSFRNTTNVDNGCAAPAMVAPGQHALASLAGVGLPLLFLGNDGGLWRSLDGVAEQGIPCSADDASHFDNLNGGIGSLAEVVQFSQHPTDANVLLTGLGANGTAATSTASDLSAWGQLANGEGGFSAIDPITPTKWYASTAAGVSITYCAEGSACAPADFDTLPTIGAPQVTQDVSLLDPPWLLDPALSSNVLIGTCRVWRGPAAQSTAWPATNVLSSEFGGPQNSACNATNNFVRSLAAGGPASTASTAASSGSTVLYAGMAGVLDGGGSVGGHIYTTRAANTASSATAWTDLSSSPVTNDAASGGVFNQAGFDVSSIAVDPHDTTGMTVYASIMGFTGNGVTVAHAYRSTDGGAHWTNISSNLPDAPANSIAIDPKDANTVYIAMDTGVYVTNQVTSCATANCWNVYGVGLPNAPVVQLLASATTSAGGGVNGVLRAATYGRGIWQIPLLTASPGTSAAVTLTPMALAFPTQAVGATSAPQTILVTNSGNAALVVSSISTAGPFTETDDCVTSPVAAGASCAVQVIFAPIAVGTASGMLTLSANVTGGQATAALTGTGAAPGAVLLTPMSLNFGTVTVGQTSATQSVAVQNTGGVAVMLQSESVSGDFQVTSNGCGGSLDAGASCVISVLFAPTARGTRNGSLTVVDSAGTQLASLTGVAASPATDTLSATSLTFAAQMVGTTSNYQTVFLTNTGDTALNSVSVFIGSGDFQGDFPSDFQVASYCPASLSGHAACAMQVAFAPTSVGTLTGSLVVDDQYGSQSVALTGNAVAVPTVQLTPSTLTFPLTVIGQKSTAQQVFVTNAGAGTLTVASIAMTGDFTETDNCANRTLSGQNSCNLQVTFAPTASGSRTGSITVMGTLPGQLGTAVVSGSAVAPAAIVLTPASLDFGVIKVGQTSPPQSIAISNTGELTATLQVPTVSRDYQLTANTCGATLAPGVGCTVSIVFAPTGTGVRSGILNVQDSAGNQRASLTGTATSPPTDALSPRSLTFAAQQAGTTSAAQTVTLANTGDDPLTLIAAQISSGPFTVSSGTASGGAASGCGPTLPGHTSCTLQVAFAPTVAGPATGTLTVSDALRTQTVSLSGSAFAPPTVGVTPSQVTFPATGVGQASGVQTVAVSNSGNGQLTIAAVSASGPFSETDNCAGRSLTGTATCSIQVTFLPTTSGVFSGTLLVTGTVAGQQATVALNGTGAAPAAIVLTPSSLDFGAVTLGAMSAVQNMTISNTGGQTATLQTITVAGDFSVTAETCGQSLPPQTGCTVSLAFTPKAAGARTGSISVTDSAGVQTATLTGRGQAPAADALSPLSLSFGDQNVGGATATQAVTLTNAGDDPLTLIAVQVSTANFTAVNSCGPILAGHSSCAIQVAFAPTRAGQLTASMTVSDQFRSQTVALSGTGHAPPTVDLAPSSLSFTATPVGGSSVAQTVVLSNSGDGQLTVAKIATSGDFVETDSCIGVILNLDQTCNLSVAFNPTTSGTRAGVLMVNGTLAGEAAAVTLTGEGAPPAAIVLDPTSLTFGTVTVGSISASLYLTISNTGGVAATISSVSVTGDFTLSANTCGESLGPSTGCTVGIAFAPTVSGTRTGTLTVTDSVGTQTATITGTGAISATDTLAPTSLTFAPQQIETVSVSQQVVLTNSGDNPLTLISAQIASGDFAATNSCGSSLTGHSSCAISVVSIPKNVGPDTGILTVSDQFRTQTIVLNGTGVAPPGITLSPLAGLTFGATGITTLSAPQGITLSNNGGGPLSIAAITVTGDFSIPAATNACPAMLAADASCAFQVVFAPIVAGPRTGTITARTNAPGPSLRLPLQGTGVDLLLNANGATTVTIGSGDAAVYPLLLSGAVGTPGTATLACTGAPANATCVVTPSSAPLSGTTTVSLTVDTGVKVAVLERGPAGRNIIWWACLALPIVLPFVRRRRLQLLCLSCALMLTAGCGSGRTIPGDGGGGDGPPVITPSGTYPIIASATSAGLTRSITLTLVVR